MSISKEIRHRIPLETVMRLPVYRSHLRVLAIQGTKVVSSKTLANETSVSDALLRRDLSYLGPTGRPGVGYDVRGLLDRLTQALGLDRTWSIAIIGYGSLGSALAKYEGFAADGINVGAIFDIDPAKVGTEVGTLRVSPIHSAPDILREKGIEIAVITVPAARAQEAIDMAVNSGVTSILNFAPATVTVPAGIILRQVDISTELQVLTFLKTLTNASS